MEENKNLFRRLAILLVKGYRLLLSPVMGNNCRFHPSCSEYMIEALSRFGVVKGGWIGAKRLLRCHPWCAGGVDPLPDKK